MHLTILLTVDLSNYSKSPINDRHSLGSNLHSIGIWNPSSISSVRNKFDLLMNIIENEIYIFMISET